MDTDLLASFIGKKHDVLEQLRQLSRRQMDLIGEGDMTGLLSVLNVKQNLLVALQAVERDLDPFRQQDPDQRPWRTVADRQRCRQVSDRCDALLQEVMLIEKQSEAALRHRRDAVAHRLQGMHSASHARAAYVETLPPTMSQFDLTSDR